MTRLLPLLLPGLLLGCIGDIDDSRPDEGSEGTPPGQPGRPGAPDSIDCRDAATWPADWTAFEGKTVELINERRAKGATCGDTAYPPAPPLEVDAALREAARCHSLDMAAKGYFDHTSEDGRSPWKRIEQAGYTGNATAENIVAGTGTPESSVDAWMGSPGHCSNIMAAGSTETGLGYAFQDGSPFGHYGTQTFGAP